MFDIFKDIVKEANKTSSNAYKKSKQEAEEIGVGPESIRDFFGINDEDVDRKKESE